MEIKNFCNGFYIKYKIYKIKKNLSNIGVVGTILYYYQKLLERFIPTRRTSFLVSKYALYPLLCRLNTSDLKVFGKIFSALEYSCLDDMTGVDLVVDCGAYIGYSSAYFLSRFPDCHLVAIEPDPDNYLMLMKNLAPYKDRVRMIHSAVWSHALPLTLEEAKFRDGREWSRQVRKCLPNETPIFTAVDIATILKESGRDRISILKIDVEGAEGVIFSANYENWIDRVDTILIELHDDSSFGNCSDIFFSVVSKRDFRCFRCGEVTVCRRSIKE